MNFLSAYSNFLKSFSFADILMIEDHEQGTLRKDPAIADFLEQLKTITLRKSNWYVLSVFTVICWNISFLLTFWLIENYE